MLVAHTMRTPNIPNATPSAPSAHVGVGLDGGTHNFAPRAPLTQSNLASKRARIRLFVPVTPPQTEVVEDAGWFIRYSAIRSSSSSSLAAAVSSSITV